ncbi:hypothetical protein GOV08_01535 [Candidatus Woesearchaeota archaeon]|nr:hypothetical protein [Candidatus Woesearchaeota archaeon]
MRSSIDAVVKSAFAYWRKTNSLVFFQEIVGEVGIEVNKMARMNSSNLFNKKLEQKHSGLKSPFRGK